MHATLSETEANYAVDRLGGHMGDIAKFLDLRRKGMSVQGIPLLSYNDSSSYGLICFLDAINGIVAGSVARLSNVFSQRPPDFDEKIWNGVSRAMFECLTTNSMNMISLAQVEDHAKKIVKEAKWKDVKFVARELTKLNILRFVDFESIAFHRPVFAPAFKLLKEKESFKREF